MNDLMIVMTTHYTDGLGGDIVITVVLIAYIVYLLFAL